MGESYIYFFTNINIYFSFSFKYSIDDQQIFQLNSINKIHNTLKWNFEIVIVLFDWNIWFIVVTNLFENFLYSLFYFICISFLIIFKHIRNVILLIFASPSLTRSVSPWKRQLTKKLPAVISKARSTPWKEIEFIIQQNRSLGPGKFSIIYILLFAWK